ncbi:TIR-like protein FxsC [Streptomyces sp. MB09-02B]|uniref:TIR-like protein FxsC n=1 Tax=Streptomyces sp. MB09-02B TaxID=3028667 RepID=UPI0029B5F244|nr:TIR-like protein FxsC [Streptomyces sp. MB09-02B]MDX3640649.1 TIR-like protein FxsC [Streptomyces sp. MB09-02B]
MPDQGRPSARDPLARVVAALYAAAPELDGTAIAECLWLASLMDMRAEDADGGRRDRPHGTAPTDGQADDESGPESGEAGNGLHERLAGATMAIRGDAVAPAHAPGLPRTLEVTRALRPWKRRWPKGRRSVLDVDATVDSYARSGELIPVLAPAPERWFDLVLVLDRSPAMGVWREIVMDFTAVLDRLGAFRTLHLRELRFSGGGFELRDKQGRLTSPRQLRSPDGRRLVVVVSDCAAPGWRGTAVWRQLRDWAQMAPVALLNPLPTKLWRRTGLDLPSARVTATAPGPPNARLLFQPPVLPDESDAGGEGERHDRGWLPIPVFSLSPHSLNRWSCALMRTAPEGNAAVLVPRGGRTEGRPRQRPGAVATEGFLHTASPPAARLAVLCSTFDRLSTRLLHLIRQELVPEATVSDIAELLTSGLFALSPGDDGVVEMSPPETVQRRLQGELAEHEVWRINRALSRHVASQDSWGGRLPAVVPNSDGRTEHLAAAQPFGQLSGRTLELLGLPTGDPAVPDAGSEPEERERPIPPHPLPRVTSASVDNRPYFFLSYAHTPPQGAADGDPDHWVHTLFKDLCADVLALTAHPPGAPVGFVDREMRSGEGWPDRLSENIARCRVFVPLYSPRYFSSENCGREWFAFSERIREARNAGYGDIPAIVPVLWTGMDLEGLPESARHLQIAHSGFGERYSSHGIYGLIKLRRLRDEYEEIVFGLAQRIVQVAETTPLPSGRPRPYESTHSAFRPPGENPSSVRLIVAAPARHALAGGRDASPYGEGATDWNPYHSESRRPLAATAEELIRSLGYRVTVSDFDDLDQSSGSPTTGGEHDPRSAGEATPTSGPTILLVDRWALLARDRRRRLKQFDSAAQRWVCAIVPWSRLDTQCRGEQGERLREDLEDTLPLLLEQGRRGRMWSAVNGVPTLKAFTEILPVVMAQATRQYLRYSAAPRAVPPAAPSGRGPRLSATGPDRVPPDNGV